MIETLCKDSPVVAEAYSNRSDAFFQMQQYRAALHDASTAIQIDASQSRSHYRKAKALLKLDLIPEAT